MAIKYLSGNRLQGTAAERTALNLSSPPATSWKELARASLSGAGDTITTSTFTPKDNMKVLTFGLASGNIEAALQVGNGSIDTGSNYSVRWQVNGTEGTGTSKPSIDTNHTATGNEFVTYDILNVANQEKLVIADLVDSNSAGAGNAPNRVEHVGKWANTSNQINIVQAKNVGGGSFDTGSEIVVLGYDNDEADSGTSFWQELANVDTTGDNHTTGTFTAKKYLMVDVNVVTTGGAVSQRLTFNDDTGSNYAQRRSGDGASDSPSGSAKVSIDGLNDDLVTNSVGFTRYFIINVADKEKLVIADAISGEAAGAGNAPTRDECVFKWANTSAQITKIDLDNNKAGDWASGSFIKVWGAD